jgi:8-oxo-dGTP pyrophosphatase MutT (NUDIX family)
MKLKIEKIRIPFSKLWPRRTVICIFLHVLGNTVRFGYHWPMKAFLKNEETYTTVGGGMEGDALSFFEAEREVREEYGASVVRQTKFYKLTMAPRSFESTDGTWKEYYPVLAIYTGTQTKWQSREVHSMHWCSIEEFEALAGFSPEKKALLLEMIAVAYRDYGDKFPPQNT